MHLALADRLSCLFGRSRRDVEMAYNLLHKPFMAIGYIEKPAKFMA